MSSDKETVVNDNMAPQELGFGDLLGDKVEPLAGKGAHRAVTPVKLTPGMQARRDGAQLSQVKETNPLDSISVIKQVDPHDILNFSRPGVQHGVFKKLRQGKYEIQSVLDLHRHSVEQAREALWMYSADCQAQGVRCALVTHGKGEGRENPARLKSCVNHWLRQMDQVLAFHSAQKLHGGVGATYILIKKNATARRRTADKIEREGKGKR